MNNYVPKLADKLSGCDVLPPMIDDRLARPEYAAPVTSRTNNEPPKGSKNSTGNADRGPTRDRFHQLNAFLDFTARKLIRSELLVWLTLYRDGRDGISKTAQADIARRTGLSLRSVGLAVSRLERLGLLMIVQRGGLRQGPSTYRLSPRITEK